MYPESADILEILLALDLETRDKVLEEVTDYCNSIYDTEGDPI